MRRYILRRIAESIIVFFGITLVSFAVMHLAPGNPIEVQTQFNIKASYDVKQKLIELYGLDKPVLVQYTDWLKRLLRLDFGNSLVDGKPVIEKIAKALPITLLINFLSLLLILLVAIPLGITSAVKHNTAVDHAITVLVFIGFAMPSFWLALLLMMLFGVQLKVLPVSGLYSYLHDLMPPFEKALDVAKHLILPVFVSAFGSLAGLSRYTKTSMMEVLSQEYIRTARAKGLPERVVIYKHALKNALLPVVTILGMSLPSLIGGSVIFESIFAIPGMGFLFYQSVMSRDYPTIMGILVLGAILTLLGNLLADIAYTWVDPRIRYQEK